MSKRNECPWCGETTGAAYTRMQEAAVKITANESEEMNKWKNEPLDSHSKLLLAAMSYGNSVFDCSGHPWIKGGGVCSRYALIRLAAKKYIEVNPQNFDDGKVGRCWKITKLGQKTIANIMNQE